MLIGCANCGVQLTVPAAALGKRVKCPLCKIVFSAPHSQASRDEPEDQERGDRITRRRAPDLAPLDDAPVPSIRRSGYDDDDDYRRRGRSRSYRRHDDFYDDDDDAWGGRHDREIERARSSVLGPAICLMILGSIFALVGLFLILMAILNRPADTGGRVILLVFSMFCLAWGGFIITGGIMMKSLKFYGLAMTASILALLNHPCFVLHLLFGIWAIVVLNQVDVRRAFRWNSEHQGTWP